MPEQFAEIVGSFEEAGQSGIFDQKRVPGIEIVDVFAARKIASGLEALLIQAEPSLLPGIEEWPQSEGFHIEIRPNVGRPGLAPLVCLELSAPEFREVFFSLAEDVCTVIRQQSDPREAIQAMNRRLVRWQQFLKKHRPDGLVQEERVGLFGELEILRVLFLKVLDPVQAVEGWRGCKKANQDFQYNGFALEAKTTRAATPDRIHISNVQQLDDEGIERMFLSVVWVDQNESAGVSLPSIVAEIRRSLPDPVLSLFNEGLMEVGYLDRHGPLYEKELYRTKEIMSYTVEDGFPRMTRDQVPDGVKDVKYQISIDACRPFLVEEEKLYSAVQELKEQDRS